MQRPASVIILAAIGGFLGIVGLIFCSFSLVGSIMVLVGQEDAVAQMADSGLDLSEGSLMLLGLTEFIALGISLLLIAGSVGIFMLKKWGRVCMITYALTTLPNNFCMAVLYLQGTLPTAMEQNPAAAEAPTEVIVALAIACFGCFWFILNLYPIFVLIFLNTKSVKYAFETGGAPPEGPWGGGGFGGDPHAYREAQPYPQGYYPPPGAQQDQPAPQPPQYPYYPPQGDQGGGYSPPPDPGQYQPPEPPPSDDQRRE